MSILGDAIRQVRDTLKFAHEECGGKDVIDELKDIAKAMLEHFNEKKYGKQS